MDDSLVFFGWRVLNLNVPVIKSTNDPPSSRRYSASVHCPCSGKNDATQQLGCPIASLASMEVGRLVNERLTI